MLKQATSDEITPDRLAELRRIAEAATPGPWERRYVAGENCWPYIESAGAIRRFICRLGIDDGMSTHDGEHIATFDPPTVLALLDEIERLRRERETLADGFRAAVEVARERAGMGPIEFVFGYGSSYEQEQAAIKALSLLDGARGSVMDRGQDEDDFIPPELVDTACPVCDEPRLWCWCDGEKGGGGA